MCFMVKEIKKKMHENKLLSKERKKRLGKFNVFHIMLNRGRFFSMKYIPVTIFTMTTLFILFYLFRNNNIT